MREKIINVFSCVSTFFVFSLFSCDDKSREIERRKIFDCETQIAYIYTFSPMALGDDYAYDKNLSKLEIDKEIKKGIQADIDKSYFSITSTPHRRLYEQYQETGKVLDPWGNEFYYEFTDDLGWIIKSKGPDGIKGTDDDITERTGPGAAAA